MLFSLALLAWAFISIVAGQFLAAIPFVLLLGNHLSDPLWTTIYTALSYTLGLVICIIVPHEIAKRHKKSALKTTREELGLSGLPTWTDIGLAPLGFIVYLILALLLAAAFTLFPWFDPNQAQNVGFNGLFGVADRLLAFVSLVVIAPIAEEIIFRGWLYGKLRSRLSLIPAALLVSLLFGFLHGQWNVAVNVFAMSLVLCGLREITGTIYSGILLHMLKNGFAFYLLYIVM